MKAHVDQDLCVGCGACVAVCSAVFQFNDEGRSEADNGNIDALTELCTEQAAANCPVGAIIIS